MLDGSEKGTATGSLVYQVPSGGSVGLLMHNVSVLNNDSATWLSSYSNVEWSVSGSSGEVDVSSDFFVDEAGIPDWSAYLVGSYGSNEFSLLVSEHDFGNDNDEFVLSGSGVYGGSSEDWFGSL